MMSTPKLFRIRSFVRRDGRGTIAQERARAEYWPQLGLQVEQGLISFQALFGRLAPCYLEIGFGSGESLLALAQARPDCDFIGVETHKPGIGALLLGVHAITNLRLYNADAVDVLEKCIPDASLSGAQLFFPDPWPKRRHHPRRIIQPSFVQLLGKKLKTGASLHLATDWEDYAKHMMKVLSAAEEFENLAGFYQFADRSPRRPVVTKFERRALRDGRQVWELQFKKL